MSLEACLDCIAWLGGETASKHKILRSPLLHNRGSPSGCRLQAVRQGAQDRATLPSKTNKARSRSEPGWRRIAAASCVNNHSPVDRCHCATDCHARPKEGSSYSATHPPHLSLHLPFTLSLSPSLSHSHPQLFKATLATSPTPLPYNQPPIMIIGGFTGLVLFVACILLILASGKRHSFLSH